MKKKIFILTVAVLTQLYGTAQTYYGTQAPALPFLDMAPGSNATAMGNTGTGVGDECTPYYNIAKVALQQEKIGVNVAYMPTLSKVFSDAHLANAQYYQKVGQGNAYALGMTYYTIGNVFLKDDYGNETSQIKPHDVSFYASYVKYHGEQDIAENYRNAGSALAITFRSYFSSALKGVEVGNVGVGKSVAGVCANISYYKQWFIHGDDTRLGSWGFTINNLGPKVDYYNNASGEKNYLPANLRFGYGVSKEKYGNIFTWGVDLNKLLVPTPPKVDSTGKVISGKVYDRSVIGSWFSSLMDAPGGIGEELQEFQLCTGAEYLYNNKLYLRGGLCFQSKQKGNNSFVSFGTGYKTDYFGNNFDVNVGYRASMNNSNQIANTFFINLKYKFKEN